MKRVLINGNGTFDRIVSNVKEASQFLGITLRINIDEFVKDEFEHLFSDIECLAANNRVSVYLGRISSDVTSACASIESTCINVEEFAKMHKPFFELATKKGYPLSWYPKSTPGGCGATCQHSTVIEPDGNMCRCWSQVGNTEESYANICKQSFNGNNLYKWLLYNPFENNQCLECKILPLCVGGCPAKRIPATTEYMSGNNKVQNLCAATKYNIAEMLLLLYEYKQNKETINHKQSVDFQS